MAATQLVLGYSLMDEVYTVLESIFGFPNLETYQVYHSYNRGYSVRPFHEDYDRTGAV
ncbi:hypothetical protein RvY_11759 [Ramazzottius varieornatus]|uniref:Uncharacterized protein n=1 Tax=Ramazzottius varieornatus TaxID=947166 RepID=A0A1D1VH90_RAMVA|nr:hypothetical protein RvY_11759 [Ramazzottius varieornatus]